jgi:hypothetical protein
LTHDFFALGFAASKGRRSLGEIHPVLRPGGKLGLGWTARDKTLAWVVESTKNPDPRERNAPRYRIMNWKRAFDDTKLFSRIQVQHLSNAQFGTVGTLVDRTGSISFSSTRCRPLAFEVWNQTRKLVQLPPETKDRSEVKLPYRIDAYWCERV